MKAVLSAAAKTGEVKRVVLTSSFASVVDIEKKVDSDFVYTGEHWNPLTYEEAISPDTNAIVAYRGSKKFAGLEAWNFVKDEKTSFDLVTLCPPMTFGPIVHPVNDASQLNESNAKLWEVATGKDLPEQRVPVWIDVRDLAQAHIEALVRPEVGGNRYAIASPEKWSYELAAMTLRQKYPDLQDKVVRIGDVKTPKSYSLESDRVSRELGISFRSFQSSVTDLFDGLHDRGMAP